MRSWTGCNVATNYDATDYNEKRTHGEEPEPGTPDFGARAKVRHARLMEQTINAVRPKASDLGKVGAVQQVEQARKRTEDLLKEAGE